MLLRQKEEAADLFYQKKERRQHSVNRAFYGDYIGLDEAPGELKNFLIGGNRVTKKESWLLWKISGTGKFYQAVGSITALDQPAVYGYLSQ